MDGGIDNQFSDSHLSLLPNRTTFPCQHIDGEAKEAADDSVSLYLVVTIHPTGGYHDVLIASPSWSKLRVIRATISNQFLMKR